MRHLRKESKVRSVEDTSGAAAPMIHGPGTHSREYLTGSFVPPLISKFLVGESETGWRAFDMDTSWDDRDCCSALEYQRTACPNLRSSGGSWTRPRWREARISPVAQLEFSQPFCRATSMPADLNMDEELCREVGINAAVADSIHGCNLADHGGNVHCNSDRFLDVQFVEPGTDRERLL